LAGVSIKSKEERLELHMVVMMMPLFPPPPLAYRAMLLLSKGEGKVGAQCQGVLVVQVGHLFATIASNRDIRG
jgi:hypothetical protein